MYMESAPGLTELYYELCWRKLVLFIYRDVFYLKNQLIHKCNIY